MQNQTRVEEIVKTADAYRREKAKFLAHLMQLKRELPMISQGAATDEEFLDTLIVIKADTDVINSLKELSSRTVRIYVISSGCAKEQIYMDKNGDLQISAGSTLPAIRWFLKL